MAATASLCVAGNDSFRRSVTAAATGGMNGERPSPASRTVIVALANLDRRRQAHGRYALNRVPAAD